MPPLRERIEDIPWLIELFFENAIDRNISILKGVSSLTIEAALSHPWPGNVRELRNRVERAVALSLGEWLMPADMFPQKRAAANVPELLDGSLHATREAAEKRRIESALREAGGHISATAKTLGISRTTLWERMRKLGISNSN
jgi:DNA-binding NtrC family response regulator